MPTTTVKGSTVPAPGDDLLASWGAFDSSIGTIVSADSTAAMRTRLASAEAAGYGASAAHPWYFDMNGQVWRADGTKQDGTYVLQPINEPEFDQKVSTSTWTFGLSSGADQQLATTGLGQRPWRRAVTATWTCFAQITAGVGEAYLKIGDDVVFGRYSSDAWGTSQSVTAQGVIMEGTAPSITAGLHGAWGQSGMSMQFTNSNRAYSRLTVVAYPITMD